MLRYLTFVFLLAACGGTEPAPRWVGQLFEEDAQGDTIRVVVCTEQECICYEDMNVDECPPVEQEQDAWGCCK